MHDSYSSATCLCSILCSQRAGHRERYKDELRISPAPEQRCMLGAHVVSASNHWQHRFLAVVPFALELLQSWISICVLLVESVCILLTGPGCDGWEGYRARWEGSP